MSDLGGLGKRGPGDGPGGSTLDTILTILKGILAALNNLTTAIKALLPSTSPTFAQITLNNGAAGESPLQHYQEGTWTPTIAFGGGSVGLTYSQQLGTYTRIGREIICRFSITLTAKGTSTGAATIGGLPVSSHNDPTNAGAGGMAPVYANLALLTEVPIISVGANSLTASLLTSGAANSAALTDADFTNTSSISGSFRYFA